MKDTRKSEALSEALVHLRAINAVLQGLAADSTAPAADALKPAAMAMRDRGRWWLAPVTQRVEDILRLRSITEGDLLYTAEDVTKAARTPLSLEDIEKHCGHLDLSDPDWVRQVVRATEAAHGIGTKENHNGAHGE